MRARIAGAPLLAVSSLAVAVALVGALGHAAAFVRIGYQDLGRPPRLTRDADLDPLSYYAPTGPLAVARAVIPPGDSYAIVVGDDPPVGDHELVRVVFRLWLLPRRPTSKLADAQWVIGYHHSSETLGVAYTEEIGLGPDVNVVRVKR